MVPHRSSNFKSIIKGYKLNKVHLLQNKTIPSTDQSQRMLYIFKSQKYNQNVFPH